MGEELAEIRERDNNPNPIRSLLSIELADEIVVNKRCQICNSAHRKEVEDLYDQGSSCTRIQKALAERGEQVSVQNILHHVKTHFKNMERTAFLLDYCDRLDELRARRRRREDDLQSLVDTAMLELSRIIAMPTGDMNREKCRNEMMLKTMTSIRESIEAMGDMEDKDTAVKAVEVNFAKAWKKCMDTADPGQKKMYVEALKEFRKNLEGSKA
jgi:hypothetical protein